MVAEEIELLLMRHGRATAPEPSGGDAERVLHERGKEEALAVGALLVKMNLRPEYVMCSSAARAVQTARKVADTCDFSGELNVDKRLYLAEPSVYFDVFSELERGMRRLLVVGHNPGISDLVEQMTGKIRSMPTAAVAIVRLQVTEMHQIERRSRARLTDFLLPD